MTRIVDLSAPIHSSPPGTSDFQRNRVDFFDHAAGAAEIRTLYGVPGRLLRNGEGWTRELVSLGTHNSTHVDAPYHYNSTIAGRPADTIDELPIDRFYGPGVVLEFRDRADGEAIDVADVNSALAVAGHELSSGDIVLMRTGRDQFYGQADYIDRGPGVTAAATRMMHAAGVRVMGIDAWGWDRPLKMQAEEALAKDEAGIFWEAHQADLDYCQIERLVNLVELPATGFTVACFPLRVVGASAAPARVVAIFPD